MMHVSLNNSTFLQPLTWKIVITADKEVGCNNNLSFSLTNFISLSIFGSANPLFVINFEKIDLFLD